MQKKSSRLPLLTGWSAPIRRLGESESVQGRESMVPPQNPCTQADRCPGKFLFGGTLPVSKVFLRRPALITNDWKSRFKVNPGSLDGRELSRASSSVRLPLDSANGNCGAAGLLVSLRHQSTGTLTEHEWPVHCPNPSPTLKSGGFSLRCTLLDGLESSMGCVGRAGSTMSLNPSSPHVSKRVLSMPNQQPYAQLRAV